MCDYMITCQGQDITRYKCHNMHDSLPGICKHVLLKKKLNLLYCLVIDLIIGENTLVKQICVNTVNEVKQKEIYKN